jgi:exodeoxyribonuclease III
MIQKIISYNVNGIRAAMDKGLIHWMKSTNPDILCIQETKAQPEQISTGLFEELGFKSYWFSAQKKGYSGVGILSKIEPQRVTCGMGIDKYDFEGRFIQADYGDTSVISVYHPSGSSGDERQAFKMQWLIDFTEYIRELEKQRPKLIICGDFNICRLWIDIHSPEKQQGLSGFLPEERDWFQQFIDLGFTDTFRMFNNEPHQYSWWSYRQGARQKNKGWRIDYHIITKNLEPSVKQISIHPEAIHSDHCPVGLVIDVG